MCKHQKERNYGSSAESLNPGPINLQIGVRCCDISLIWGRESRWIGQHSVKRQFLVWPTLLVCVSMCVCKHESKFVLEFVCESDDSTFSSTRALNRLRLAHLNRVWACAVAAHPPIGQKIKTTAKPTAMWFQSVKRRSCFHHVFYMLEHKRSVIRHLESGSEKPHMEVVWTATDRILLVAGTQRMWEWACLCGRGATVFFFFCGTHEKGQ